MGRQQVARPGRQETLLRHCRFVSYSRHSTNTLGRSKMNTISVRTRHMINEIHVLCIRSIPCFPRPAILKV